MSFGTDTQYFATLAVSGDVLYAVDAVSGALFAFHGNLHAVTAGTGKRAWAYPSTATGFNGLTVAGGRVYFTTSLAVQAIDAKNGRAIWAFQAPAGKSLLSTPAVADGLVFIGCSDDALYAIKK